MSSDLSKVEGKMVYLMALKFTLMHSGFIQASLSKIKELFKDF